MQRMQRWAEVKQEAVDRAARAYWREVRAAATSGRVVNVSEAARLSGLARADAKRHLERYAPEGRGKVGR